MAVAIPIGKPAYKLESARLPIMFTGLAVNISMFNLFHTRHSHRIEILRLLF